MKLKTPEDYPRMAFLRECQECGHFQEAKDPKGAPTEAYLQHKCRRCHSESLDYGSVRRNQVVALAQSGDIVVPCEKCTSPAKWTEWWTERLLCDEHAK